MNMPLPAPEPDRSSLSGLEDLLDKAHIEVAESDSRDPSLNTTLNFGLLQRLVNLNTTLCETRNRLDEVHKRMSQMVATMDEQEERLKLMAHYKAQAERVFELQTWLDATNAENERLKTPWWRRFMQP